MMNWRRPLIVGGLLVVAVLGFLLAEAAAQLYLWQSYEAGTYFYEILFESQAWLVPAAIALGLIFGAVYGTSEKSRQLSEEPPERDGFIQRHAAFGAFLEHWVATVGMILLVLSGIWLGFLFVPRLAGTTETVGLALNVHWVGTGLLVFAVSYHVSALFMGAHRDIVPEVSDFRKAVRDVGHYLGMTDAPEADKYKPIQKVSYLAWGALVGIMTITGVLMALDYVAAVSGSVRAASTFLHELFALFTILFLLAHVAITLMPSHWAMLRSQVTGWMPADYVREKLPRWNVQRRTDGGTESEEPPNP